MNLEKILNEKAKILVVGLGYRTGLMTANFLAERNFSVEVCDVKNADNLQSVSSKLDSRVKLHAGRQDIALLDNGYSLIVLSPGVPAKIDLITHAVQSGIPVIAEVELAYFYMKGTWIAITGTDGKSTTTAMTGYVLEKLKFSTLVGGNIGIPLISLTSQSSDSSVVVAELSSFQLETIVNFRPEISVIMNMGMDHLDRYDSMNDYFLAKKNIFRNQIEEDIFLRNLDDEMICDGTKDIKPGVLSYSLKNDAADIFYRDGSVYFRNDGKVIELFEKSAMFIPGLHNIQNAMVCFLLVYSLYKKRNLDVEIGELVKHITSFKGLEHRMEICGTYGNRRFINDSKATTVGAVEVALKSLDANSVFILGGRGKGDDYSRLAGIMKDNVRGVVLIGETRDEFETFFSDFLHASADSMNDAVVKSFEMSKPGDTVILSPACASFDMFENFEERGRAFKNSVNLLSEGRI
ncbi:MAG: UDP-N-acetylmuramoyl-L-alanine--D-glutamate ligase [Spirochaetes bacterium]|nr:UDP-N-acetylmuramoyl-L-alanine--D-glutamate ligase [Spirochaetota bacterium]